VTGARNAVQRRAALVAVDPGPVHGSVSVPLTTASLGSDGHTITVTGTADGRLPASGRTLRDEAVRWRLRSGPAKLREASAVTVAPLIPGQLRARRAGFVGVTHGVAIPGMELFYAEVHLLGGPAPVRRYLPELIDLIWNRTIDPGKVFDLTLPLDQVAEGYRAMDERRAIKTLLVPD
jgi:threonine dehydrogenase-like Zn-dependent dehydrogenase